MSAKVSSRQNTLVPLSHRSFLLPWVALWIRKYMQKYFKGDEPAHSPEYIPAAKCWFLFVLLYDVWQDNDGLAMRRALIRPTGSLRDKHCVLSAIWDPGYSVFIRYGLMWAPMKDNIDPLTFVAEKRKLLGACRGRWWLEVGASSHLDVCILFSKQEDIINAQSETKTAQVRQSRPDLVGIKRRPCPCKVSFKAKQAGSNCS